jgi:hypothetical protein
VSQLPSSRTLANAAIVDHIRQIFAVESEIDKLRSESEQRGQELPLEVVHTLRQDKAKPVLEKFKTWVDELLPGTPPNSALGKALGYTHRQWEKLARYVDHPDVPCHNNFVEQKIKHYATGRNYPQIEVMQVFPRALNRGHTRVDSITRHLSIAAVSAPAMFQDALRPRTLHNYRPCRNRRTSSLGRYRSGVRDGGRKAFSARSFICKSAST